jgi:hypothetical protein
LLNGLKHSLTLQRALLTGNCRAFQVSRLSFFTREAGKQQKSYFQPPGQGAQVHCAEDAVIACSSSVQVRVVLAAQSGSRSTPLALKLNVPFAENAQGTQQVALLVENRSFPPKNLGISRIFSRCPWLYQVNSVFFR